MEMKHKMMKKISSHYEHPLLMAMVVATIEQKVQYQIPAILVWDSNLLAEKY